MYYCDLYKMSCYLESTFYIFLEINCCLNPFKYRYAHCGLRHKLFQQVKGLFDHIKHNTICKIKSSPVG